MPHPAEECLEQALTYWEDRCMEREIFCRIMDAAVRTDMDEEGFRLLGLWRKYRSVLLDNQIERLDWEEWSPLDSEFGQEAFKELAAINSYPLEFFAWTRKSRRVFSIPELEQEIFTRAMMPEIQWGDILWPFESFCIELGTPIPFEPQKRKRFSCTHVLISHLWLGEKDKMILVRMLDGTGAVPPLYTKVERGKLIPALKRNDLRTMMRASRAADRRQREGFLGQGATSFILYSSTTDPADSYVLLDDESIEERVNSDSPSLFSSILRAIPADQRPGLAAIARIVVGTCLYLDSLAKNVTLAWEPRRRKGSRYIGPLGIITDETLVCRILGRSTIDPAAIRDVERREGQGFVRPHWRRRHRRRPAFTPPDHPKTIIVPPRLINAAFVPLFGILSGSITRMLSAEEEFR